ncbi:MAG: type I methionyl aminopeptidase [Candidatus Komeilibacteria bacterium RIFOXYC1_FULL_37_11]|uniref:Methionine aminopeptidase n=1 Tax=Candidatus Komeilibacteria bacterium RIFOXYC1_FULL_37_11 TaxID=1798555 RepID=A0A1G2C083_9BACT|nr:MAG: type I methionyl aminopeptidase [Candidatus Komeilibacteria bacterium RIFOXYC1_FULL_37_11]OGY95364.1 MAG: type I methionyl aminopeptidase [Candidatus Komeilibacteria bacterium RIFOXYD1_FULL_37_29]
MLDKKTPEEIKILREGGKKLGQILRQLVEETVVGNTGRKLNDRAEKLIKQAGGVPSFKNYQGFPAALCVSINDVVVHGIPTDESFQEGDLVGLDLGMQYKGLYTDTAITVGVGRISSAAEKLLFATKKSLDLAISQLKVGGYISDIGQTIEQFIKPYGYGIVRDLAGHGVGRQVHENPSIPNYYIGRNSVKIFDGMVIAIEPMLIINNNWRIKIKNNKWDVVSQDGSLTAHFEHSVAITQDGPIILTE